MAKAKTSEEVQQEEALVQEMGELVEEMNELVAKMGEQIDETPLPIEPTISELENVRRVGDEETAS